MTESQTPAEKMRAQGIEARKQGLLATANPYPSASPEAAAWDQGWTSLDTPPDAPLVETPTG